MFLHTHATIPVSESSWKCLTRSQCSVNVAVMKKYIKSSKGLKCEQIKGKNSMVNWSSIYESPKLRHLNRCPIETLKNNVVFLDSLEKLIAI